MTALELKRLKVFSLFRSRANLHLSYNPAGRSHCRLQNHQYIKHHHRRSLILQPLHSFTYVVGTSPTSHLILKLFRCFTYVIGTSPASQLILQPFRFITYVTGTSPGEPHMHKGMKKQCVVD